jgi:hypothetical protein
MNQSIDVSFDSMKAALFLEFRFFTNYYSGDHTTKKKLD